MTTRLLGALLALALLTAPPTHARADAPGPGERSGSMMARSDDSAGEMGMEDDLLGGGPSIPPRPVPDYDGRPDPSIDAGDALLWIPRVLFWPVYAILDYVIRRPVGFLLTTAERERWDAVQFPPFASTDPKWGLVPTVFFDFGFQPTAGLYFWINDALARRNQMRFQVAVGGLRWLRLSVLDRYHFSPHEREFVEVKVEALMRPDRIFVGLGQEARGNDVSRYGRRQLEGTVALHLRPWRASYVRVSAGVTANEFYDGTYGDEPSIDTAVRRGIYNLPPGFEGYVGIWQRLEGAIDTRLPRPRPASGVRVEAHAELGFDALRPVESRWLLYGGAAGAFWDVDSGRTLGLWLASSFATPLGSMDVPFTELPDLGGRGRMTAFRHGWVTGPSVVSASLEYRYPIWVSIDAFVNASVGNAFGHHLDGFDVRDLRMSFALGLRTVGDPDQSLTIQLGVGTDPFRDGMSPCIVRITAGTQEGF